MKKVILHNLLKTIQIFAFGMFVYSFFLSSFAYAYWGEGKSCAEQRIFDKEGLSEEEIKKIEAIYKAEYEFCMARKALADKEAKKGEKDEMGTFTYPYASKLELDDFSANGTASDRDLRGMLERGKYSAAQAIKDLHSAYPTMTNNLVKKASTYQKLKAENPEIFKKSQEVSTDNYTGNTATNLLAEAAGASNVTGGATSSDREAAALVRRTAASVVVKTTGNEEFGKDMVEAEKIISARETAGLTTNQARTYVNNREDAMKEATKIEKITNAECDIQGMRKKYQSSCYSCIIIKTLITTFMDACAKVQDITTEAGTIILQIALMLWLTFFVLKQLSGFTNIEPGNMINTLFITLFKCLVAYVFITSGVSAFTTYIIEPLMDAGASYGIGLMKGSPAHLELTPQTTVTTKGTSIVSANLINNIMGFTESLDRTVSTNLIIGHAVTCHSFHAGMWQWHIPYLDVTIAIPNIWLWLCGAAVWFCGFMLTLGIGYYMLDISFKLGFAIIAFPVVAALWPFDITKDKFQKCVSIVLKSAATFAMLAMTASYALELVSSAFRGTDEFLAKVEAGDAEWVSETFDITGPCFILIVFAYLYSLKLISSTISDYVDRFFPDGVMGNQTPMHHQLTRITDMAKQKAMKPVSYAADVVTHQTGRLGGAMAGGALRGAIKGAKFVKNKITGGNKSKQSSGNNAVSNAGTATKNTGKTMEQTGKMTEQAGKAAEQGGKAAAKGGDAMMNAGKGLSSTGLGAIVGVPMMIAGAAVKAGGTAVQYAGTATKKAGQAMKKSGKAMKKIGERMEKAGAKMEKTGLSWKNKGGQMGKKNNDANNDDSNDTDGTDN